MAFLDFDSEDIIHKISAKFVHAYLPDSKKPYYLKSVHQPDLDIHALAGKAEVYNINTDPKIIEEGFQAAMRLMRYLIADGYRIKTPLFTLRTRFPGEYDGTETHLTGEHHPEVRLQATANAFWSPCFSSKWRKSSKVVASGAPSSVKSMPMNFLIA